MKQKNITDLLALLVFTLFALCVLSVLQTGAGVYRKLVSGGEEAYTARTAVQYLSTRVRQAEAVTVEDFDGCEALVCRETIAGKPYVTRVYCHDGWLRELFCAETARLSPEDGEKLLPSEGASFSLEDGMLTIRTGGRRLTLLLRAGREAPP